MVRTVFTLPGLLLSLALMGLAVYCLMLFIMLAQRGIKALDIYIRKNESENSGE